MSSPLGDAAKAAAKVSKLPGASSGQRGQVEGLNKADRRGRKILRSAQPTLEAQEGLPDLEDPEQQPHEQSAEAKKSIAKDATNDAKRVAGGVLKGAARGGAVGAGTALATGILKSKTFWRWAGMSMIAMSLPIFMLIGIFGGQNGSGMNQALSSGAYNATSASLGNDENWSALEAAGTMSGTDPTILSAIYKIQQEKGLKGGMGPMGIDMKKSEKIDPDLTEDMANELEASAQWVGQQLQESMLRANDKHETLPIDAGYSRIVVVEDKDQRIELEGEEAKAHRDNAKAYWIAVIESLPLTEIGDRSETIFELALQWTLGKATMCAAPAGSPDAAVGQTTVKLTEKQRMYAQLIINAVADYGLGEHAAVISLATAMQESTLQMYWNSSVPGSKELADGGPEGGFDLGPGKKSLSVGLFQQQIFADGTWGTVNDGMDPAKSTGMFLKVLTTDPRLKGWEEMPITVAAQKVQRSAHPSAYAKWETQARTIVRDMPPTGSNQYKEGHSEGVIELAGQQNAESEKSEEKQGSGGGVEAVGGDSSHLKIDPNVRPDTKAVMRAIMDLFPSHVYTMGGMRQGSVGHGSGRATDLMIKDYKSEQGIKAGDTIAQFLIDNRAALGVEYLIWRDQIWTGPEKGWREYSKGGFGKHLASRGWNDTTLHHDHIHAEMYGSAGTGGELKVNGNVIDGISASTGNGVDDGCGTAGAAGSPQTGVAVGIGDDYPYRDPQGVSSRPQDGCNSASCIDPWRTYKRECVSFVAYRVNKQMGWKEGQPHLFTPSALGLDRFGNATYWKDNLGKAGYKTDDIPAIGAIAWFKGNGGYHAGPMGHVAMVSETHDDGTVSIEQYNRKAWSYSTARIPLSEVDGFIHVADIDINANAGENSEEVDAG